MIVQRLATLLLAMTLLSQGCAQYPPTFTPEELAYWSRQKELTEEFVRLTRSIPATMPRGDGSFTESLREWYDWCDESDEKVEAYFNEARQPTPPELFKEYHQYSLEMNRLCLAFGLDTIAMCREYAKALEKIFHKSLGKTEHQRRGDQITADFEAQLDELFRHYESLGQTYYANQTKALESVNRELRLRLGSGQGEEVQLKSAFSVTYQPYMVPVTVRINSRGEITFESKSAIPTPIGIFSIGAEIGTGRKHTLTMVWEGKQHVYDLSEAAFVLDFSETEQTLREMRYEAERRRLIVVVE